MGLWTLLPRGQRCLSESNHHYKFQNCELIFHMTKAQWIDIYTARLIERGVLLDAADIVELGARLYDIFQNENPVLVADTDFGWLL